MRNTENTTMTATTTETFSELNVNDTSLCIDTTPLSTTEQRMLERHETIINQGKNAVLEVGRSLLAIQRGRLYRADHASFNEYCRERWGFGRQRGYELLNAAIVGDDLSASGVQVDTLNERQLRSVTRLKDADQRVAAFTRAQELAGDKKLISRHVEEAVDEILGTKTEIIDVEPINTPATAKNTITVSSPHAVTRDDIATAIDALRDIATTLKVQDAFNEPLDRLEGMIDQLLERKWQDTEDFAGTV